LVIFILGCHRSQTHPVTPLTSGTALGQVDSRLEEASGLVASVSNPGFLWTINDSGNLPEIFLIDQHASIRLVCRLANIQNRDWEDIAIDAGPDGKYYLYVADIGDNFSRYEHKLIYRLKEPVLSGKKEVVVTQFETFVLRMPDGKRDAETLLIDPLTHDLFIISKREDSVGLYQVPNPLCQGVMTLTKVLTMPFRQIVAGSISADGQKVLLKNYNTIYYWKKSAGESLPQLLATKPMQLPYQPEPQGEAISWSRDGTEFFTLSESTWRNRADLIVHRKTLLGDKSPW